VNSGRIKRAFFSQAVDRARDGIVCAVVEHRGVLTGVNRVAPPFEDLLLPVLAPSSAFSDQGDGRFGAFEPYCEVRELCRVAALAPHPYLPPVGIKRELARRLPPPAASFRPRCRPPDEDPVRDRRPRRSAILCMTAARSRYRNATTYMIRPSIAMPSRWTARSNCPHSSGGPGLRARPQLRGDDHLATVRDRSPGESLNPASPSK
jgi:hypothetical protein